MKLFDKLNKKRIHQKERKAVDFTIVSTPISIEFFCPNCEWDVEIPWSDIDVPDCWGDAWPTVLCPECGAKIVLGSWVYD